MCVDKKDVRKGAIFTSLDDAYVLQYDPAYILSSAALQNCIGYQDIEHYGLNDSLY